MKIYSQYGFNDFVIILGYKSYCIKEYFTNYFLHQRDVTIDMSNRKMEVLNNSSEPWKVTLLDTGLNSMKRIHLMLKKFKFRLKKYNLDTIEKFYIKNKEFRINNKYLDFK